MQKGTEKPDAQVGFEEWSQKFFTYLDREIRRRNLPLTELANCLGLVGCRILAASIFNFLSREPYRGYRESRQKVGKRAKAGLSKVARDLRRAGTSYCNLLALAKEIERRELLGADSPPDLPGFLEKEATRLDRQLRLASVAFSKKRMGINANHGILIQLQEFVKEFGRRWNNRLPLAAKELTSTDIADLLEAGKTALGQPEGLTDTDAESIDKALNRFRKHKDNRPLNEMLKKLALAECDLCEPPSTAWSPLIAFATKSSTT